MNWSGLLKFLTGFSLAIALIFFAGVNITRYLITRLTALPPKPIFPNDTLTSPATSPPTVTPTPAASPPPAEPSAASPTEQPSPVFTSPPLPSPSPPEPGAYAARVTEPIGLIVRQDPNQDAERLGGVEYDQRIIVLETSPDGEWTRIRLADGGTEGWVKSGNLEQINQ